MVKSSSSLALPPGLAEDPAPHGDAPAPDALYRRHSAWLLSALRKRFGREAAEDLAQETFLRLARSQPQAIAHPKALLLKIALNAFRDQARASAVRPQLTPTDDTDRHGALAHQHQALVLKETILRLPPKLREVFVLSRFAGLTNAEIARRCGIGQKTVEKRMTKALKICATALDQP